MTSNRNLSEPPIVTAFLKRYLRDVDDGLHHEVEHYQRLFPGYEDAIAREYDGIVEAPADPEALRIGRYEIVRVIGSGGQGEVYLATDQALGRKVAVKVLRDLGSSSPSTVRRFRREAAVAARIDHPGIATVYETGLENGVHYFAMQYVEGETLGSRLARQRKALRAGVRNGAHDQTDGPAGPPGRDEILRSVEVLEGAARAAHVAHEAGVLHRDLKPSNIIVDEAGRPVILDFGLARDLEQPEVTLLGSLFGTPDYMAPEQLTADRVPLDRRSDVYALAVTLYECITLRRPFEEVTRGALLNAILVKEPAPAARLNPMVPRDLSVVLHTAMAKDRDRRYHTAREFADDLRRVREGRPVLARPPGRIQRIVRWVKREPLKFAAMILLAALIGTGGYIIAKWPEHEANAMRIDALEERARTERALEEAFHGHDQLEAFERIVAESPHLPEAVAGLALALRRRHRPAEAIAVLDRRPEFAENLAPVRAIILRGMGDLEAAKTVVASTPSANDHLSSFIQGMVEMARGHAGEHGAFERACEFLSRAALTAPGPRRLYHLELLHAAGHVRDEAAITRIADAVESCWPDSAAAWTWIMFAKTLAGLPGAAAARERALTLASNDPGVHVTLAEALGERGDYAGAAENMRAAVTLVPDNPRLLWSYGRSLQLSGRVEDAMTAYRAALVERPDYYEAWCHLGLTLDEVGRNDDAIAAHREAIKCNSERCTAYSNLAATYCKTREFDVALDVARQAIARAPDHETFPLYNLGTVHMHRGEWKRAAIAFEKAIERLAAHPGNGRVDSGVYTNLASARIQMHDFEGGREAAKVALAHKPTSDRARYLLGFANERLGDLDAAKAAYEEAIEADQHAVSAAWRLGHIQSAERDYEAAAETFRFVVDRESKHAMAHTRLALMLRHLGRFEESLAHFRSGHELGQTQTNWSPESAKWVARAEKLVHHSQHMEKVLRDGTSPPPLIARLYATMASKQKRFLVAIRFWRQGLAEPSAIPSTEKNPFALAARDSARAAAGEGDAATQSVAQRSRLRALALKWLAAAFRTTLGAAGKGKARRVLDEWRKDPALGSLRKPAIDAYPPSERSRWERFWTRLESEVDSIH